MAGHTQAPWRIVESEDREGNPITYISSKGHGYVPIRTPFREGAFEGEGRSDHPEAEVAANAEYIVRAVNAHEALVGALRRAIDRLECHAQWASDDVIRGYSSPTIRAIAENHESAAINDLRAALTLAEEE